MLLNLKLNAGQANVLNRNGKHVQVLTAGTDFRLIAQHASGKQFETDFRAGMKIEFPISCHSLTLLSETTQEIEIWWSDLPLDFDTSGVQQVARRIRGGSAVAAFGRSELLPNDVYRKRATIQALSHVTIGGAEVSLDAGYRMQAGDTLSLECRGAISAFVAPGNLSAELLTNDTLTTMDSAGVNLRNVQISPSGLAVGWDLLSPAQIYLENLPGASSPQVSGKGDLDGANILGVDGLGRLYVQLYYNTVESKYWLARYNRDGSLDTTFYKEVASQILGVGGDGKLVVCQLSSVLYQVSRDGGETWKAYTFPSHSQNSTQRLWVLDDEHFIIQQWNSSSTKIMNLTTLTVTNGPSLDIHQDCGFVAYDGGAVCAKGDYVYIWKDGVMTQKTVGTGLKLLSACPVGASIVAAGVGGIFVSWDGQSDFVQVADPFNGHAFEAVSYPLVSVSVSDTGRVYLFATQWNSNEQPIYIYEADAVVTGDLYFPALTYVEELF